MHVHIVLCCGAIRYCLPTSYQKCWCDIIINLYLFTNFYTSKHLGKRVTQTCMFTLFFVVVRKGFVYQQVIRMLVSYH